ncbi:hypothetical protein BR93DRAFT_693281 [Coniochaeta sp. PMI_546]|nr:hypothetical protein BR93DRAFT_693281 [Coniochaeta sp. PMI_546]
MQTCQASIRISCTSWINPCLALRADRMPRTQNESSVADKRLVSMDCKPVAFTSYLALVTSAILLRDLASPCKSQRRLVYHSGHNIDNAMVVF